MGPESRTVRIKCANRRHGASAPVVATVRGTQVRERRVPLDTIDTSRTGASAVDETGAVLPHDGHRDVVEVVDTDRLLMRCSCGDWWATGSGLPAYLAGVDRHRSVHTSELPGAVRVRSGRRG